MIKSSEIQEVRVEPGNAVLKVAFRYLRRKRGRGFILKQMVKYFPRLNNAKLTIHDLKIDLNLANDSDIGYFYGNGLNHEQLFQHLLINLCNTQTVFYDIGSNIGYYCFLLSKWAKQCYAFEPNPVLAKRIGDTIQRNTISNVRLFEKGISKISGNLLFYYETSRHDLGSLIRPEHPSKESLVEVVTLDTCMEKYNLLHPDLIKIDTEGTELDILEGYKNLHSHKPVILLEWIMDPVHQEIKYKRLNKILNDEFLVYRISEESGIQIWEGRDEFHSNNLLIIHKTDIRKAILDRYIFSPANTGQSMT